MKVTRLIIGGIPYKLVKAKGLVMDDACGVCSLYAVCHRSKDKDMDELEPRYLCDMEGRADADTFFVVDLDIDKTIKEVLNDKL